MKRFRRILNLLSVILLFLFSWPSIKAQTPNLITRTVDISQVRVLANYRPSWASAANHVGTVPADEQSNHLTLVLSRSPQQEQAFEELLINQQNPASPDFHHWLTPEEVGARFGLSDSDIATLTGWLQSQGLHVNWISPSRIFIGFGGSVGDVNRAFQTELHYYQVSGEQRMSVSTDPTIPEALVSAIKTVRGLYTPDEHPLNHKASTQSASPEFSLYGEHYLSPADFDTIYDIPASWTGAGQSIGIVGWSRTNFADFANLRSLTGASFPNPIEIIPTAYGGVDPGPASTSTSKPATEGQDEATLDVTRAGGVAPGATLLLVVSSKSKGGIDAGAQYLIQSSPVPANVISISFGACESNAGSSGVTFWDSLFKQAAAEGISVFVSSGDSGASACDTSFATPSTSPTANSTNSICSSSYATCIGGTEFNDIDNSSSYWNSSSTTRLLSARGYIPEGGWNEPLGSKSNIQVAGSGGGVSKFIATPSWQTAAGVPAARTGRYTPDVSFSSASHDGYFVCYAAAGGSCASVRDFMIFSGTSAAAPSMAGIAALLNQKAGGPQGNLNPQLYQLAASAPSAFHDVTVTSSGVANCNVNTPSMCNNSAPGTSGLTGGQPGYLVTDGYDEVTGLGSLDVANFLNAWSGTSAESAAATPAFNPPAGTYATPQSVTISDATAGATIYYTTDGTTPTMSSTVYGGPVTVSSTETIKAIAIATGYSVSPVASATYTINIPPSTPVISSISPAYTSAGGSGFTLTVNGAGFTSQSTVAWGGTTLSTQYVSAAQLKAQVPASDIASAGTSSIAVQTPGAGTSNTMSFEVDSASSGITPPTFSSPTATVTAGATATYTVTLPTTATSSSATCLNLPVGATCSYSASTGAITVATLPTTPKGTYQVTVVFIETVSGAAAAGVMLPMFLLPLWFARNQRRGLRVWLTICAGIVLTMAAFTIGCGGGGGSSTPTSPTNPTHQITTSGAVTLTVQ